jgi:hypothetical protein
MFNKQIEFISHKDYVNLNQDHPIPIKLNIPSWFKKLKHGSLNNKKFTIKGCMPFLDTLTSGYLLKIPQDYQIEHNVLNEDTKKMDSFYRTGDMFHDLIKAKGINLSSERASIHDLIQVEGSPFSEMNKNLPIYKFLNPWIIKTPPGYSCLFLPPLNNSDDRFSIIPGIVDTDTFQQEINFPMLINGDKYNSLKTIIKKGTPYVQVIPFKRESWKMKIIGVDTNKFNSKKIFYGLKILNNYKERFWSKKSWS